VVPDDNDTNTDGDDGVVSQDAMIHLISQLLNKDPHQRLGRTILGGESIVAHPALTTSIKFRYNIQELRKQTIPAPWIPPAPSTRTFTNPTTATTTNETTESITATDRFQQQYPKLSKREKALFDAF
jgi:hypothetical protein